MRSGYLAPAVLSANYLGPSILALKLGGLPLVFGMTIFAGSCEAALSKYCGCLKRALGGMGEEKLSTSIKRCWRVAIAILGATAYFAGTPSRPQISRDSE